MDIRHIPSHVHTTAVSNASSNAISSDIFDVASQSEQLDNEHNAPRAHTSAEASRFVFDARGIIVASPAYQEPQASINKLITQDAGGSHDVNRDAPRTSMLCLLDLDRFSFEIVRHLLMCDGAIVKLSRIQGLDDAVKHLESGGDPAKNIYKSFATHAKLIKVPSRYVEVIKSLCGIISKASYSVLTNCKPIYALINHLVCAIETAMSLYGAKEIYLSNSQKCLLLKVMGIALFYRDASLKGGATASMIESFFADCYILDQDIEMLRVRSKDPLINDLLQVVGISELKDLYCYLIVNDLDATHLDIPRNIIVKTIFHHHSSSLIPKNEIYARAPTSVGAESMFRLQTPSQAGFSLRLKSALSKNERLWLKDVIEMVCDNTGIPLPKEIMLTSASLPHSPANFLRKMNDFKEVFLFKREIDNVLYHHEPCCPEYVEIRLLHQQTIMRMYNSIHAAASMFPEEFSMIIKTPEMMALAVLHHHMSIGALLNLPCVCIADERIAFLSSMASWLLSILATYNFNPEVLNARSAVIQEQSKSMSDKLFKNNQTISEECYEKCQSSPLSLIGKLELELLSRSLREGIAINQKIMPNRPLSVIRVLIITCLSQDASKDLAASLNYDKWCLGNLIMADTKKKKLVKSQSCHCSNGDLAALLTCANIALQTISHSTTHRSKQIKDEQ